MTGETKVAGRERDPGLLTAIEAAGGLRALARKLGRTHQALGKWRTVPRCEVFAIAAASGVDAEILRPDLADWIRAERTRRLLERAREKFAVRTGMTAGATATIKRPEKGDPQTFDLLDLGMVTAATRFAAEERGLTVRAVFAAPPGGAGGKPTAEQSARAYGAALAVVVGRVSSETVAGVLCLTRQNVDGAAERYLRARDGDDPEDGETVMERGRVRRAKSAEDGLWEAERRFVAELAGEGGS